MKLNKLLLCSLLALALVLPAVHAEDGAAPEPTPEVQAAESESPPEPEEESNPSPEATQEADADPVPDPTAEPAPTDDAGGEPTAEPSTAPDATSDPDATPAPDAGTDPSPSPDTTPEGDPSPEPTPDPNASIDPGTSPETTLDPNATVDPGASPEATIDPSVTVTPEPTQIPQPGEDTGLVTIRVEGSAVEKDGVWQITLDSPDASLRFSWAVDGEALSYHLYTADAQGALSYCGETSSSGTSLSSQAYASGQYTLYVGAVLADGSVTWGSTRFELVSGRFPGGFPSGGRSGGSSGAPEEQGFRVTPGEALTSDHASGTRDMTPYTATGIESSTDPIAHIYVGDTQAKITLDGGKNAFTAQLDGANLTLRPVDDGSEWSLSLLALHALHEGGVERLVLHFGSAFRSIPTDMEPGGSLYGSFRSQGYVAKDFEITVNASGLHLSINNCDYSIDKSGKLMPLEG